MAEERTTSMSPTSETAPIVVGVDGSPDALRAVDWAAGYAARTDRSLRLVYAYERPEALLPAVAVTLPALPEDVKGVALDEARDRVAAAYPDVAVTAVTREGTPARVLIDQSADAAVLVLGREGLGRFSEFVLGSVSLACATQATVPTVIIPAAWDAPAQPHGRIVVGVDGSENCQAAIEYAFETAATNGAALVAVFAWHMPARWPEGWPLAVDEPRFSEEYGRIVAESIAGWREKYPDVHVDIVTDVGHPAAALERASAEADLVVIGGRRHGAVAGMLLGSVARTILRHLALPVAVVHEPSQ